MSKTRIGVGLALALVAASGIALAQSGGQRPGMGPGMGPGMMQGRGMMGPGMMMGRGQAMMGGCMMGERGDTFIKGRVAFLKAEFVITAAQQPAFDAFASAMTANFESMRAMRDTMQSTMSDAKSPVDRMGAHVAMMENQVAAMKVMQPALEALYGTFSDDQKKKADDVLMGMGCMG